jgi:alpha-1,2-mannosyltransferase
VHNIVFLTHFLITVVGVLGIFWASRYPLRGGAFSFDRNMPVWATAVTVLVMIAFTCIGFRLSSPPEWFWDFTRAYYSAGRDVVQGDMAALHVLIREGATGGFVNIPIVAYLFAPFGILPPRMAGALFTVVGVALTVLAWLLLVRLAKLDVRERWILALLFIANGPLLTGIKFGNLSYVILVALAGGLFFIRSGRSGIAGALIGLAVVIKPVLILMGLFFLLRRDWRGSLSFAAVGVTTALLSLLVFGWTENLEWFQNCIVQYSQNWLPTFSVQSISGFILRLDATAKISEWILVPPTQLQKLAAQIVTALIFLAGALACLKPAAVKRADIAQLPDERRDLQYLLVVCLCIVTSPLAWSHYYAWLLLPTAFFLKSHALGDMPAGARWAGWIAIICVTPLNGWPSLISNPLLMNIYRSLFMSHMLLGGLIWFGLICWWLARKGGLFSKWRSIKNGSPLAV